MEEIKNNFTNEDMLDFAQWSAKPENYWKVIHHSETSKPYFIWSELLEKWIEENKL